MTAKLDFQKDVANNYIAADKLNFGTFNILLSSSTGAPAANADVGSLYVDTNSGNLYRKTVSGAGASNWSQIASVTSTIFQNHYHNILQNTAVTATDTGAASFGDLVGIYGAGAWNLSSAVLSISRQLFCGAGSNNSGLVVGGSAASGVVTTTELFNGTSWSTSGNSNLSKFRQTCTGAQSAALYTSGQTVGATTTTELFNGSTWTLTSNLNVSTANAGSAGYQNSTIILGGDNTASYYSRTEWFNGSTWTFSGNLNISRNQMAAQGTQNATIVAGGQSVGAVQLNSTELFNGTAWITTSVLSRSKQLLSGGGSQNSFLVAGGQISTNQNISELFNGSIWSLSGNLTASKSAAASGGGQNNGFFVGGQIAAVQNTTELHAQTTYRKLYSREYAGAKSVGILINANTVQQQGSVTTSVVYVPNKYLIVNRYLNSKPANDVSLTAIVLTSIQGTAPNITYNFSATVLSVMPGMMAVVTSSGATPGPAGTYGTFLIKTITNPSSMVLVNNTSVSQNPATGTISFISTMLAVDQIGPQDIVIGRTDDNGYLNIHKTIAVSSLNKRLK